MLNQSATTSQTPREADGAWLKSPELAAAREFALPVLTGLAMDTGEPVIHHADAVVAVLQSIDLPASGCAAVYLCYASGQLKDPSAVLARRFDAPTVALALETQQLIHLQHQARRKAAAAAASAAKLPGQGATAALQARQQTEQVRKMLLAFSRDIRVVLLRLASRLQTLRYCAAHKVPVPPSMAQETLQIFAPLANRLGLGSIKWELEDLGFRFAQSEDYYAIALQLGDKRREREAYIAALQSRMGVAMQQLGIVATVQARPKHIYSIYKKMRSKGLAFEQVMDLRAVRILLPSVAECYTALSWLHENFSPIEGEYDDYIARPKANGYQSLHSVVRDASGKAIEVQIRTHAMHQAAEQGSAAHWVYKEAGEAGSSSKAGKSDTNSENSYEQKMALLRQLLVWQSEVSAPTEPATELAVDGADTANSPVKTLQLATPRSSHGVSDVLSEHIYVLTPDAKVLELSQGATAIDFAYQLHTELGHRCRGARVDGKLQALNTPLRNGQTVDIITTKEGGPSRDWLNPELGFVHSNRARAKVRAWFNAQAWDATTARGRDEVEKLLQREGRTSWAHEALAVQLGFKDAPSLFLSVGKDEFSLKTIRDLWHPAEGVNLNRAASTAPENGAAKPFGAGTGSQSESNSRSPVSVHDSSKSLVANAPDKVLLVGVAGTGSVMNQLARCCKPIKPDPIGGFVARGKGVSVHRQVCNNFLHLSQTLPERVVLVSWASV